MVQVFPIKRECLIKYVVVLKKRVSLIFAVINPRKNFEKGEVSNTGCVFIK